MKKLLRPKDLLMLTLAGIGDIVEEVHDPLSLLSFSYETMYGFTPKRYKRNSFIQTLKRSLKTGDIERIMKDDKIYLRLTASGKSKIQRDFPINSLIQKWNKKWVIVLFDIAEKSRIIRDRFRKKLQDIGFGMLQESVWITPLPIGKEMLEFIEANGFSRSAFVLEVSHFLLGDSRDLARRVWKLDFLEEQYQNLREEISNTDQLIKSYYDRSKKREAKTKLKLPGAFYRLEEKQRTLKRKYLEFVISLPSLPKELLPESLQDLQPLKLVK